MPILDRVEVFKTNVTDSFDAIKLKTILLKEFPHSKINFDLQDCDKILRIEGSQIPVSRVIQIIKHEGFHCQLLEEL